MIRNHTIRQGQWTAPQFAAESFVGSHYVVVDTFNDEYSANPADYWHASDSDPVGDIVKRHHSYRTVTGRLVSGPLFLKSGTVGDLRRLARAATKLVL